MRVAIIYYSATGNTKKISQAIYQGLKEAIPQSDLLAIKQIEPQKVANYDLIGIGAPIWYFREPANVRHFIYQMPNMVNKLCFMFCTHGASPMGIFYSMAPALKRKGLSIIGWNDWYGSVYQVLHAPKPYFTDGHPDSIDLAEAFKFGKEMAERALRISAGEKGLIPQIPSGPKAEPPTFRPHPLGQPFPSTPEKGMEPPSKFERKIDMSKCLYPQCKICVDNCPASSIDFSVKPPIIKKGCFNDFLCDRLCPAGAIGIGEEKLKFVRTVKTINMQKCKYPECTLCIDHCPMDSIDFSIYPPVFKHNCEGDDLCWVICPEGAIEITNMEETHGAMYKRTSTEETRKNHPFLKFLEEAESQGKFRRLVPLDKVGWENPIYKMQKTPRFDIKKLLD